MPLFLTNIPGIRMGRVVIATVNGGQKFLGIHPDSISLVSGDWYFPLRPAANSDHFRATTPPLARA